MSDFPVCPEGYNDDPVVLQHIALEGHHHPTDHSLVLACCAPVWFNVTRSPDVKQMRRRVMLCPGCALATQRWLK